MTGLAAVVLTGGAARRMGGRDKTGVPVGGVAMRDRVLAAVAAADPRIVVGPLVGPPPGVLTVREEPPGGGPVAAVAAGLALLTKGGTAPTPGRPTDGAGGGELVGDDAAGADLVAVLAGDLPLLTAHAVDLLVDRVRTRAVDGTRYADGNLHVDGALYVDETGRRQLLCGVWRTVALGDAITRLAAQRGGALAGASMRALLADLTVAEVTWPDAGPPPWFDCDTDQDVRRAQKWTR